MFPAEAPQLGWNACLVVIEPALGPATLKIAPPLVKQKIEAWAAPGSAFMVLPAAGFGGHCCSSLRPRRGPGE